MILYLEAQFEAAYKEYRYHHMHNRCEYMDADDFRKMFEDIMKVVYSYEVDDKDRF